MTGLRSYLADIYEQSENIMKATEQMRYEEFLGDTLYNAGLLKIRGNNTGRIRKKTYLSNPLRRSVLHT